MFQTYEVVQVVHQQPSQVRGSSFLFPQGPCQQKEAEQCGASAVTAALNIRLIYEANTVLASRPKFLWLHCISSQEVWLQQDSSETTRLYNHLTVKKITECMKSFSAVEQ